MIIFGIGIDVVETARIASSMQRFGDRFLDRVFTKREREYCDRMKFCERHYAARFAAKEAASKTFGTGFGKDANWQDIEILRRESGEPYVELHGLAEAFACENGILEVKVSLSHSDHYSVANAMAICADSETEAGA